MEVTFDISEEIMECLQEEADSRGETMSALVESALLMALPQGKLAKAGRPPVKPVEEPLPPLPTWKAEFLVDVSNREELYRVLDNAEDSHMKRLYGYKPGRASEE